MSDASHRLGDRLSVFARHPWRTLLGLALVVGIASAQMVDLETGKSRLELDPSIDSLLSEGDEGRIYFERVKQLFDSGENVLIGLFSEDGIFTPARLQALQSMTEELEGLDEVLYVSSLSTAVHIEGTDGTLRVDPFFDEVPSTPSEFAALREEALGDPIYAGNLVSRDGRVAVIAVQLLDVPESELLATRFDERVRAIAEAGRGDMDVWITGSAHIKAEITRVMMSDLSTVLPISWLMMGLVALVAFRSLRGVAIPLAMVGVAVVVTLAFLARFEGRMNQVTVAVPPILVVIGFAYSIHILTAWVDAVRDGARDREAAVAKALRHVSIPIVFTGLTTTVGFLSLLTSPLGAVRQFGVYSALGVGVSTLLALTVVPALLRILPLPRRLHASEGRSAAVIDVWLERVGRFAVQRRREIFAVGLGLSLLGLAGIPRIVVGSDLVSNLPTDNQSRVDFEAFNRALEGAGSFRIVFESAAEGSFKEPENLRALESLEDWLERQPEVGGVTSLADYIRLMHESVQDGDPAYRTIPDSRELVSQLLILGDNEELERFVDSQYRVASMSVRTTAVDSDDLVHLVRRVERRLDALRGSLEARVTGSSVLVAETMDDIALGQALSVATAFLVIGAILSLLFTSFRVGCIALIPNVLPVLAYFGILGWSGVTLNIVTGLVAPLVLGIAVDDTIHLFAQFNRAARQRADEREGAVEAVVQVGRPVTYTTVALCIGFLCLAGSTLTSQVEFGILSATTFAIAWAADLTFTPALASTLRLVTLWDVLALDLGEEPEKSIPLFQGLRPRQARIAVLMGRLETLEAGQRLLEQGDAGTDFYTVIDGELAVRTGQGADTLVLRTLRRGDLVGEIGLVTGERSASVDAVTPARLLRLGRSDLERLEGRYPRIAARIARNLSRTLGEKLALLTYEYDAAQRAALGNRD